MKTTDWDRIVTSAPLNKQASIARDGKGVSWDIPDRRRTNVFDAPPPMKPYKDIPANDITGQRFQKLVVVGLRERPTGSGGASWVCRCDCGRYHCSSAKGLRELRAGGRAMCGECDYLEEVKAQRHATKETKAASDAAKEARRVHDAEVRAQTHPLLAELRDQLRAAGVGPDDFVRALADFVRLERDSLKQAREVDA